MNIITAVVFYPQGTYPFEVEDDSTKTIEDWVEYFKTETKKIADTKYASVFYIRRGNQTIYLNLEFIKRLAKW